ncbi:hypothetical protein V8B55DRAFT_1514731 [Mucor lusitanicus]
MLQFMEMLHVLGSAFVLDLADHLRIQIPVFRVLLGLVVGSVAFEFIVNLFALFAVHRVSVDGGMCHGINVLCGGGGLVLGSSIIRHVCSSFFQRKRKKR